MKYVIWSFEHAAWWGPNRMGYTTDLDKAGRYSATDAGEIVIMSVWLDEVAMLEQLASENGPPKHHPYRGFIA